MAILRKGISSIIVSVKRHLHLPTKFQLSQAVRHIISGEAVSHAKVTPKFFYSLQSRVKFPPLLYYLLKFWEILLSFRVFGLIEWIRVVSQTIS
jgi:hypothetical protein